MNFAPEGMYTVFFLHLNEISQYTLIEKYSSGINVSYISFILLVLDTSSEQFKLLQDKNKWYEKSIRDENFLITWK